MQALSFSSAFLRGRNGRVQMFTVISFVLAMTSTQAEQVRQRSCYPKGCAATGFVQCQCNARGSLSKLAGVPPRRKINVTSKSPVGDISVVTLIRTDTTLDHSQKAEKV
jgi:hypothetical protein